MGRVRNHETWCEQTLGLTCFRKRKPRQYGKIITQTFQAYRPTTCTSFDHAFHSMLVCNRDVRLPPTRHGREEII